MTLAVNVQLELLDIFNWNIAQGAQGIISRHLTQIGHLNADQSVGLVVPVKMLCPYAIGQHHHCVDIVKLDVVCSRARIILESRRDGHFEELYGNIHVALVLSH